MSNPVEIDSITYRRYLQEEGSLPRDSEAEMRRQALNRLMQGPLTEAEQQIGERLNEMKDQGEWRTMEGRAEYRGLQEIQRTGIANPGVWPKKR